MPSKLYLSPGNPVVWTHAGGDRLLDAMRGRRMLRLTSRYVAPVMVNFADEILSTTGNHTVTMRAIPQEQQ